MMDYLEEAKFRSNLFEENRERHDAVKAQTALLFAIAEQLSALTEQAKRIADVLEDTIPSDGDGFLHVRAMIEQN